MDQLIGVLTDAYGSRSAITFHLVCYEDILAENVVADDLRADDSSDNLTSVDTDSHVEVPQGWVLGLVALLSDDIDHFQSDLDHPKGFLDLDDWRTALLRDLAGVTHDNVAVTDSMDLIDADLLTKLIELAKQS